MKIETVCGSIRFSKEMMKYRDEQLSNGKWVLIPENMELDAQINDRIKAKMDILHKSKIEVADTVLIWNGKDLNCLCHPYLTFLQGHINLPTSL